MVNKRVTISGKLLDYISHRLGDVPVEKYAGEYDFHCIYCLDRKGSESSKRKLGVNLAKGKAHCFRCGYSAHTLEDFFRDLNGGRLRVTELAFIERSFDTPQKQNIRNTVLEIIYGDDDEDEESTTLKCPDLPDEMVWLADSKPRGGLKKAFDYLTTRGVTQAQIEKYDIGYCVRGSHANHLIFPVVQGGELVYWTTRSVRKNPYLKSKNPKQEDGYYSKSLCLFNYDNVVGADRVEIGEGVFDAFAYPNGVGGLGKKYSPTQIELLVALVEYGTKEFVIGLDSGTGKEADVLYSKLVGRVPKVTQLTLTNGDDPDERREDIEELLKTRRTPTALDRVRSRLQR